MVRKEFMVGVWLHRVRALSAPYPITVGRASLIVQQIDQARTRCNRTPTVLRAFGEFAALLVENAQFRLNPLPVRLWVK